MGVSVVIPTLNEASCLATTLKNVRDQQPQEIIVADGGSKDATCEIAMAADRLIGSRPGRATQMNAGAAHAQGDILLFLHADCLLEPGALAEAEQMLSNPSIAAGCFRMSVNVNGLLYRSIEACATARVRLTGIIYGDQGLFLRRTLFHKLGGFPVLRLMEDVWLSKRLRKEGRIVVAPKHVLVSPRRWQKSGLIRQSLLNWTLTALAIAGIHPDHLARFYPQIR